MATARTGFLGKIAVFRSKMYAFDAVGVDFGVLGDRFQEFAISSSVGRLRQVISSVNHGRGSVCYALTMVDTVLGRCFLPLSFRPVIHYFELN